MKKMGIADKAIFILGLTLAGVITFVLVAGVIVAVLKYYLDSKNGSVQIHSCPMVDEEPEAALIAAPFEQMPAEEIQPHDEAMAGNAENTRNE